MTEESVRYRLSGVRAVSRAERRLAETRHEIVQAAAEVFVERGYHPMRLSDIAERAGVGQGTLYRHFKDKREILDSVVARAVGRLQSAFEDENAPAMIGSLSEYRLRANDIATRLFETFAVESESLKFLVRELPAIDDEAAAVVFRIADKVQQLFQDYYRTGIERGFFRADLDIEAVSTAVLGMGGQRSVDDRPASRRCRTAAPLLQHAGRFHRPPRRALTTVG